MAQNPLLTSLIPLPLAVATAGTADVLYGMWGGDGSAVLAKAWLLTDDDVTADDTNYAQIVLSVGGNTLATMKTQATAGAGVTGDITAGTAEEFTLASAMDNLLAQGGVVTATITKPGTGVAINGRIMLGFRPVR